MIGRLLIIAAAAAALAFAQEEMGGGGGGMGGGGGRGGGMGGDMMGGGMPMRSMPKSKAEQAADKLKLNKEQKEEFQNILNAGAEEAAPLRQKLHDARLNWTGMVVSGRGEADLKKAAEQYTALAAQMIAIETKAFSKVWATLKPNQVNSERAGQAFGLMAGIFEQSAPGRGRGGR
jgi:hypothetical protein